MTMTEISGINDSGRWTFPRLFPVLGLFVPLMLADPVAAQNFSVEYVTPLMAYGAGPYWDAATRNVYFTDLSNGTINSYHPETGGFFSATIGRNVVANMTIIEERFHHVSFVIPIQNQVNRFAVGLGLTVGVVEWDGQSNVHIKPKYVIPVVDNPGNILNAGKADSNGCLWVESADTVENETDSGQRGSIFSVDSDGNVMKRLSGIGVPDGIAWSPDHTRFYYSDAFACTIVALDFDATSKTISNSKVVFDFTSNMVAGVPRGLTVDTDGNLWVACTKSEYILKIDPEAGTLLTKVALPAFGVTSVTFGGPDLDELYATTASYVLLPNSGALFRVTDTGSTGLADVAVTLSSRLDTATPPVGGL